MEKQSIFSMERLFKTIQSISFPSIKTYHLFIVSSELFLSGTDLSLRFPRDVSQDVTFLSESYRLEMLHFLLHFSIVHMCRET